MAAPSDDAELDQLPRRSKLPLVIALLVLAAGAGLWFARNRPPPPDPPERALLRTLLPAWQVARARDSGKAEAAMQKCTDAAKAWPAVAKALEGLEPAWSDRDAMKAASKELNVALKAAGLAFWVDPVFTPSPVLTTYEVLRRTKWKTAETQTEVLQVRRLDRLNVELGFLGHASGDQPAVLRDRVEVAVVDKLCTLEHGDDTRPHPVDDAAAALWREQLGTMLDPAGLAEAERRLNQREKLARDMERRLRSGSIRVTRPERLVYGDAYFEALEPYTSTRLKGGPVILASDLRALQRADEALDGSDGLKAMLAVIDHESEAVEAHEAHHALDHRELPTPPLLQALVGEGDVRFGELAERELRAFLGELRDARTPACLSVINLAKQARGRNTAATPHFFAAHALLTVLGEVAGERGLSEEQAVEVLKQLCALPDAELRQRGAKAALTLYGQPLYQATR